MARNEEIAKILLELKAVTLSPKEPYTYASGIKSPIYCDNRLVISAVEEREKVVQAMLEAVEELEYDVIAGTATAGIPWAAYLADRLKKPMIYVRDKAKEHGKGNQIEGKLEAGQRVLVIEDLISTGGSSVRAVEAVKEAGGIVEYTVAIFTYEMEKAKKSFEDASCKVITLTNFSTLIRVAKENELVTEEEGNAVLEWNKDPAGWAAKQGLE